MRVEVRPFLDDAEIERFYALYEAAFGPLRILAAARHVLSFEEFAEEVRDPRIEKYVVLDDTDYPVALTTFTGDLSAVPWISPEFYAHRYPEHTARGAVFYLGFTLIDSSVRGSGVYALTLEPIAARLVEKKAVLAYDICAHNDLVFLLSERITRAVDRLAEVAYEKVDVQSYYAMECAGPKA